MEKKVHVSIGMVKPVVRIRGYKIVPPRNEEQLLKAMANQPVAVGVGASGQAFRMQMASTG
ncbi:hypothetical protein JHK82_019333 [Glycine max]|nr:hypothetical protein JHK85_019774 [Glycine max]KAG5038509.1 hypothetical protein JHK86_019349 [Glycine max]KAG5143638.1 hypothetical protein JHK82_019333 [Glycine max]KHN31007.1 hypothetical protein glysoja_020305 [Glycine soja]